MNTMSPAPVGSPAGSAARTKWRSGGADYEQGDPHIPVSRPTDAHLGSRTLHRDHRQGWNYSEPNSDLGPPDVGTGGKGGGETVALPPHLIERRAGRGHRAD